MVTRSLSVPLDLWQEARKKAVVASSKGSLSEVIQRFLKLWITGKINLDDYED